MSTRTIVIGDGVNELVAAHYLARAGHSVLLVRERAAISGPSLEAGWIPPHVVRDLALDRHGLRIHRADPWAIAPLPGGGRLELTQDVARSAEAIGKLSARDGAKWPAFCARMHALARVLKSVYSAPPPDPLAHALRDYAQIAKLALRVRGFGRRGIEDLLRLMPMSAADWLDDWFESDALKGVLGAAGVMHLCQGPRSGGTTFNLLHHHVGSPPGVFRPPLSNLRAVLSKLPGVETRDAEVERITVSAGRVRGVALASGEALPAALVLSGAPPQRTLLELIDPGWLDPQDVRAVRNIRSRGVVAEVSLILDRDPGFSTLVVAPSLDYLERAYDDAKYGRVSRDPYIEARHVAEDGRHRLDVRAQYVPYALRDGAWDETQRNSLASLAIERLSQHVPGIASFVIAQSVLAPADLENAYGFPQGQAYQAEMALDQVLWMRPVPALAHYRTPIVGLYLCGPAMHPGGGIAGAAGAHAARMVLRVPRLRA